MGATPDLDTRIIDDDVAGDGMGQARCRVHSTAAAAAAVALIGHH